MKPTFEVCYAEGIKDDSFLVPDDDPTRNFYARMGPPVEDVWLIAHSDQTRQWPDGQKFKVYFYALHD